MADSNKLLNQYASSIFILPDEILAEILVWGLWSRGELRAHHYLHRVSQVAARWAAVVKFTPRLWAHLDTRGTVRRAALRRSGQAPLHLKILGPWSLFNSDEAVLQFFSSLEAEQRRWASLVLHEATEEIAPPPTSERVPLIGALMQAKELPILRSLCVRSSSALSQPIKMPTTPQLRHAELDFWVDWKTWRHPIKLQSLHLDGEETLIPVSEVLKWLEECPSLEALVIAADPALAMPMDRLKAELEGRPKLVLPRLTRLTLDTSSYFAIHILSLLRSGKPLEYLEIKLGQTGILDADALNHHTLKDPSNILRQTIDLTSSVAVRLRPWSISVHSEDEGITAIYLEFSLNRRRARSAMSSIAYFEFLDYSSAPAVDVEIRDLHCPDLGFLRHFPSLRSLSLHSTVSMKAIRDLSNPSAEGEQFIAPKLRNLNLRSHYVCMSRKIIGELTNLMNKRNASTEDEVDLTGNIVIRDVDTKRVLHAERQEFVLEDGGLELEEEVFRSILFAGGASQQTSIITLGTDESRSETDSLSPYVEGFIVYSDDEE